MKSKEFPESLMELVGDMQCAICLTMLSQSEVEVDTIGRLVCKDCKR